MNARRLIYQAVAVIGIGALGTYAYFTQRQSPASVEPVSPAAAAPAKGEAKKK